MKKIISVKDKMSTSILKKSYYVTLENAGQRTQGTNGNKTEGTVKRQYDFVDWRNDARNFKQWLR